MSAAANKNLRDACGIEIANIHFSKDKHPCSSLYTSEMFLWFMLWLPVGMPTAGLATTGYYSFSYCHEG